MHVLWCRFNRRNGCPFFRGKGENRKQNSLSLEPRKKKLILIFPENITETFELKSGRYRIGRHEENDIFLNDLTVSRSHAEIEITGSEAIIKDLGSLNGTFVNGSIIEKPTPLKDGMWSR